MSDFFEVEEARLQIRDARVRNAIDVTNDRLRIWNEGCLLDLPVMERADLLAWVLRSAADDLDKVRKGAMK